MTTTSRPLPPDALAGLRSVAEVCDVLRGWGRADLAERLAYFASDEDLGDGDAPLTTRRRLRITRAFETFWETGGFPEVVGLDRRLRIKTHQEYWGAMMFRDLIERHDISHPRAVSDLAHWLESGGPVPEATEG